MQPDDSDFGMQLDAAQRLVSDSSSQPDDDVNANVNATVQCEREVSVCVFDRARTTCVCGF